MEGVRLWARARAGIAALGLRAPAAGHELAVNGPRESLRGGTRKMVNYA